MSLVELYRQQLRFARKSAARLLAEFYGEFFRVKVTHERNREFSKLCRLYDPMDVFDGLLIMADMDNINHKQNLYALIRHFTEKSIDKRKMAKSVNVTNEAVEMGKRLEHIKEINARQNGTIPTRVRDSSPVNSAKRPK